MKKMLLALFLSVMPVLTYATCLIVVILHSTIYIGADSKSNTIQFDAKGNDDVYVTMSIDKIFRCKNYVFGVAGTLFFQKTKLDMWTTMNNFLSKNPRLDDNAKIQLNNILLPQLTKALLYMKKHKKYNKHMVSKSGLFCSLAIVGYQDKSNVPFAYNVSFVANNDRTKLTPRSEINIIPNESDHIIWIFGENNEPLNFLKDNPSYSPSSPIIGMNYLYSISKKYHSDDVGDPFHIIQLTRGTFVKVQ